MDTRLAFHLLPLLVASIAGCGDGSGTDAGRDVPGADTPVIMDAGRDAPGGSDGSVDSGSDSGRVDGGAMDGGPPDAAPDARADAPLDAPMADAGACVDLPPGADRPVAGACSPCRPRGPEPGTGTGMCSFHFDCMAGDNGRCSFGMIGSYCSYDQCFTDTDCAANEVCSCDGSYGDGANLCVPANCRTNADCASGVCAPSYGCLLDGGPVGWYCRTTTDSCRSDDECRMSPGGRCAYDESRRAWGCEYEICVP